MGLGDRGDTSLIELVDPAVGHSVLAGVDGVLLQSGELVAGCQSNGVCTEGGEGQQLTVVLHGADLDAVEVCHGLDGLLAEHITEAGLHVADDVDTLSVCLLLDQIAQLIAHSVVGLILAVPQESLVQNAHLGDVVCQHGVCAACDVQVALNGHVQSIRLAAQSAACNDLDLELAVGGLVHAVRDFLSALVVVGLLVIDQGQGEGNGIAGSCSASGGASRAAGGGGRRAAAGCQSSRCADDAGCLQERTTRNNVFYGKISFFTCVYASLSSKTHIVM